MHRKMIANKMPIFFGTTQSDSDCAVQIRWNQKNASRIYNLGNRFCLGAKSISTCGIHNTYTFERDATNLISLSYRRQLKFCTCYKLIDHPIFSSNQTNYTSLFVAAYDFLNHLFDTDKLNCI